MRIWFFPDLYEYKYVFSCRIFDEIFFHKMGTEMGACRCEWADESITLSSAWKPFGKYDTQKSK